MGQGVATADVALAYNSHVRHWRHIAGVGRLIETYRVTQFAGFYMEVFAVVLLGLGLLWYLFNSQRLNSEKNWGRRPTAIPILSDLACIWACWWG